jgi:hypothetical protein
MAEGQPRGGLREAIAQEFSVEAVIGGPRGIVESLLPGAVFTVFWAFTQDLRLSVVAALAPAIVLAAWRLVRREPLTQALTGVLGIGLGAVVALRTGRAQDFFVPGLVKNAGFTAVYAVSALVRWPLIGLALGLLLGEGTHWRRVPRRMRAYLLATWLWAGMFAVRTLVQAWLYSRGDAVSLGFVNILLGLPLFALTIGGTWLIVRRVPVAHPPGPAELPGPAGPGGPSEPAGTAPADPVATD